MSQTPAGWLNDPYGRFQQRYWDGERWTDRVATGGQEQVDPLGASTVIPIVTPPTAFEAAPGVTQSLAATGGGGGGTGSGLRGFLDGFGPDGHDRPRPTVQEALSGLGGVALAVGVLVGVIGDSGSRGRALAAGVAILAVAWALRSAVRIVELRAAAVGLGVVAIPTIAVSATVGDGNADFLTGALMAALFLAAWALPGFKGRNLYLGLGALALVGAFGSLSSGDRSDIDRCNQFLEDGDFDSFDAECQTVFDDASDTLLPSGLTENVGTQGVIYLAGAAVYLGGTWWLDRRGYRGTGTALGAAGLVASLVGTALLADELGETAGPLFVLAVGLVVCAVGAHGGRRATTWWGAALGAIGLASFLGVQIEPDSTTAIAGTAILVGVLLVGLPLLAEPVRRSIRAGGITPTAPSDPGFPPPVQ